MLKSRTVSSLYRLSYWNSLYWLTAMYLLANIVFSSKWLSKLSIHICIIINMLYLESLSLWSKWYFSYFTLIHIFRLCWVRGNNCFTYLNGNTSWTIYFYIPVCFFKNYKSYLVVVTSPDKSLAQPQCLRGLP